MKSGVFVYPLYSIVQLQEASIKPNQIKAKEKALKGSPCSELTATLDETIICSAGRGPVAKPDEWRACFALDFNWIDCI